MLRGMQAKAPKVNFCTEPDNVKELILKVFVILCYTFHFFPFIMVLMKFK